MFVVSPMSLLPCVRGRSPAIISIKLVFLQVSGESSAAAWPSKRGKLPTLQKSLLQTAAASPCSSHPAREDKPTAPQAEGVHADHVTQGGSGSRQGGTQTPYWRVLPAWLHSSQMKRPHEQTHPAPFGPTMPTRSRGRKSYSKPSMTGSPPELQQASSMMRTFFPCIAVQILG